MPRKHHPHQVHDRGLRAEGTRPLRGGLPDRRLAATPRRPHQDWTCSSNSFAVAFFEQLLDTSSCCLGLGGESRADQMVGLGEAGSPQRALGYAGDHGGRRDMGDGPAACAFFHGPQHGAPVEREGELNLRAQDAAERGQRDTARAGLRRSLFGGGDHDAGGERRFSPPAGGHVLVGPVLGVPLRKGDVVLAGCRGYLGIPGSAEGVVLVVLTARPR